MHCFAFLWDTTCMFYYVAVLYTKWKTIISSPEDDFETTGRRILKYKDNSRKKHTVNTIMICINRKEAW